LCTSKKWDLWHDMMGATISLGTSTGEYSNAFVSNMLPLEKDIRNYCSLRFHHSFEPRTTA
jgi:hypothetical protein